jgi:hypothetical protein
MFCIIHHILNVAAAIWFYGMGSEGMDKICGYISNIEADSPSTTCLVLPERCELALNCKRAANPLELATSCIWVSPFLQYIHFLDLIPQLLLPEMLPLLQPISEEPWRRESAVLSNHWTRLNLAS